MLPNTLRVREARLFTYEIASADMRYEAINERLIYLRNDPDLGPVVRGEICEYGPDCHINFSLVLLEYAMSCEGCQGQIAARELVECTGERLGRILAARLYQDVSDLPVDEQVSGAFSFLLRSMRAEFKAEQAGNRLRYALAACPLHAAAQTAGLNRWISVAKDGFITLCSSLLHTLAPEWALVEPSTCGTDDPLTEIVLRS